MAVNSTSLSQRAPPGPLSAQDDAESSDDSFDVVTFQASLDDSLTAARQMVASWEPDDLDPNWDADANKAQPDGGLRALMEAQSRPPR